jgi:hypothetical protein
LSRKNVTDELNKRTTRRYQGKQNAEGARPPLLKRIGTLSQRDCRDRAAVHCLLTIAGVAAVGIDDPCLIIPQFENLGAEFGAESAADTGIHVNFWRRHNNYSFFVDTVGMECGDSSLLVILYAQLLKTSMM